MIYIYIYIYIIHIYIYHKSYWVITQHNTSGFHGFIMGINRDVVYVVIHSWNLCALLHLHHGKPVKKKENGRSPGGQTPISK